MKILAGSEASLQLGQFITPPQARLRSIPNDAISERLPVVWRKVGPCLAFPKPDGWRIQIHKVGSLTYIYGRNGKDWAAELPRVTQLINSLLKEERLILDTELVGFNAEGHHVRSVRTADQYRF